MAQGCEKPPVIVSSGLPGSGQANQPVEGITWNGNVVTFYDDDPTDTSGTFTVNVQWGDGSAGLGLPVSGPTTVGGHPTYTASGSHMYVEEGTMLVPFIVSVSDSCDKSNVTQNSSVSVADAALRDTSGGTPAVAKPGPNITTAKEDTSTG